MTDEQITQWAKEADMVDLLGYWDTDISNVRKLVQIVRSAAMEEAAVTCEEAMTGIWEFHPEYVNEVGRNCCTNLAKRIRDMK